MFDIPFLHIHAPRRMPLIEPLLNTARDLVFWRIRLVALGVLFQPRQRVLQRLQVGQNQLGANSLDVTLRIPAALVPNHVRVAKIANNLANRVGLPDICQKLIAQPLALARAFDQPSDVDKLNGRGHNPPGVDNFCQLGQALIRHRHNPNVGVNRRKRIIRRQPGLVGQRREQRRFAHIRQPHNSN